MICVSMLAGAFENHIYPAFVSILHLCKHAGTVATVLSQQLIKSADLRTIIANIASETHFSASRSLTRFCVHMTYCI